MVKVTKNFSVVHCNECPFCHCKEDRSVVFDSFDEPNYDYYCHNREAFDIKDKIVGKRYIGTCLNGRQKCEIPEWCPFKKQQNKNNMTAGRKVISTIRAKKQIHGVVEQGGLYRLQELKRMYPYIDFGNEDYFEPVFPDDRFKIGNKVRYIGIESETPKDRTLVVVDIMHHMSEEGDFVSTTYLVKPVDSDERWIVKENNILPADSKWVVSFSQPYLSNSRPGVHEVDHFALHRKFSETWKQIFVFDTKEEAERVAEMFANYTMEQIFEKTTGRRLK